MKQLTLIIIIFSLQSCATIFNSKSRMIEVITTPKGAEVELDYLGVLCISPCRVEVKKGYNHTLFVSKDGYENEERKFSMSIHWTTFLNLAFSSAGLIGLGVDYFTGKMFWASINKFELDLKKEDEYEEGEELDDDSEMETDDAIELEKNKIIILPKTSQMDSIQEVFDKMEMNYQIKLYYGELPKNKIMHIRLRLYLELHNMEKENLELDLDEAIRRDHFNHSLE